MSKVKLVSVTFEGDYKDRLPYKQSRVPTVTRSLIDAHKYASRSKVFQSRVVGTALYSNGFTVRVTVERGYVFNGADIPNWLEWFVKHDDEDLEPGAFFHDPCFNLQRLGLDVSASVLTDVAVFLGMNKAKGAVVHKAVSGKIAKRLYAKQDLFDIENGMFCKVEAFM